MCLMATVLNIKAIGLGAVAHTCNPATLGDQDGQMD